MKWSISKIYILETLNSAYPINNKCDDGDRLFHFHLPVSCEQIMDQFRTKLARCISSI